VLCPLQLPGNVLQVSGRAVDVQDGVAQGLDTKVDGITVGSAVQGQRIPNVAQAFSNGYANSGQPRGGANPWHQQRTTHCDCRSVQRRGD
jgi:hypothetical protein